MVQERSLVQRAPLVLVQGPGVHLSHHACFSSASVGKYASESSRTSMWRPFRSAMYFT